MITPTRFYMESKRGYYVETDERSELVQLRKQNPEFRGCHIKEGVQWWGNIMKPGVIYPPGCENHKEIRKFNQENNHVS